MMTDPEDNYTVPCKQCQKRLGCTVKDCGDMDCQCRQVCAECNATIDRAVREAWGRAVLRQRRWW